MYNEIYSQKSRPSFLFAILLGVFVLVLFIFRPFFYALVFAVIFAVVFQPIYKKIAELMRGRQELAAFMTIFIALFFIFAPIIFFGIQILQEAQGLYFFLINSGDNNVVLRAFNDFIYNLQLVIGRPIAQNIFVSADQYLERGLVWLLQNFSIIFSNLVSLAINFFIFLIAFYYLLKDGEKIKNNIFAVSPLTSLDNKIISKKLKTAINAVTKGRLVIAMIQGILAGIGFAIFGVPNPVFWGGATVIAALIPGIGTALTLVPAIIFLFLTSGPLYGLGLLIWGMTIVGLIDNLLWPKLIASDMQLHPLIIFLSVIGGIIFFGPMGFLLGPLTLSIFFALLDIYIYLASAHDKSKDS